MRQLDISFRIIDPNDRKFFSSSEMHSATLNTVIKISKGIREQGASMVLLLASTITIFFWRWKKKKGSRENE